MCHITQYDPFLKEWVQVGEQNICPGSPVAVVHTAQNNEIKRPVKKKSFLDLDTGKEFGLCIPDNRPTDCINCHDLHEHVSRILDNLRKLSNT